MSEKPILNVADAPLREMKKGSRYAAKLGRMGALIGANELGAQYHLVAPGKAAFPRHAHHRNEEMFVVLSGTGEYRRGDETWPIRVGDVIAAPASDGTQAHQIRNTGEAELAFVAISTRHDPEVVEYPDSRKFAVASRVPKDKGLGGARTALIWREGQPSLDYWGGEDIGEKE